MKFRTKFSKLTALVCAFALLLGATIPTVTWLTNKSIGLSNSASRSESFSGGTGAGRTLAVVFKGNSVSEDISGLAFAYTLAVAGVKVENGKEANYKNATFYHSGTGKTYDVVSVGAIAHNKESGKQYTLEQCNSGSSILNVPAARLFTWDEETITFAIRIIDIPDKGLNTHITVIPYVTVKDGSKTTTFYFYGNLKTRTFNEALDGKPEQCDCFSYLISNNAINVYASINTGGPNNVGSGSSMTPVTIPSTTTKTQIVIKTDEYTVKLLPDGKITIDVKCYYGGTHHIEIPKNCRYDHH